MLFCIKLLLFMGMLFPSFYSATVSITKSEWKRIEVLLSDVESRTKLVTEFSSTKMRCGSVCQSTERCYLWCYSDDMKCWLLDFYISPAYSATSSPIINCFTTLRNDIIIGATAYASSIVSFGSYRPPANLVDGIGIEHACTETQSNPWFLFDLKAKAIIHKVIIYGGTHPYYGPKYCTNLEVRVGNVKKIDDFSSYTLFSTYPNSCPTTPITLSASSIITGQFLSIQMITGGEYFQLLHLEIDGTWQ